MYVIYSTTNGHSGNFYGLTIEMVLLLMLVMMLGHHKGTKFTLGGRVFIVHAQMSS